MNEAPMAEDHSEELPETSTEPPVSEHKAAVAAAVPLDDLILRILDEQAALADQLRSVAGDQGRIIEALRILAHDVTVLSGLVPTIAHAQTSILDQITALAAGGSRLDNQALLTELRAIRALLDRDGDRVTRLEGDPYLNLLGRRKVIGTICSMPGTYPLA
jgi:hypothetical protein